MNDHKFAAIGVKACCTCEFATGSGPILQCHLNPMTTAIIGMRQDAPNRPPKPNLSPVVNLTPRDYWCSHYAKGDLKPESIEVAHGVPAVQLRRATPH